MLPTSDVGLSTTPLLSRRNNKSCPRRQPQKSQLPQIVEISPHPTHAPFLLLIHITQRIHHPPCTPHQPTTCRREWEFQTGDKESGEHDGIVFEEVGVRTLGAVEEVGGFGGGDVLRGCVRVGVFEENGT